MAPRPATWRRGEESFAVNRNDTLGAAEHGIKTTTTGRTKMLTQGRTILVAALALAALGAGPAMAKPGGAGPGATEAIEVLDARVDDIEADVGVLETDVGVLETDVDALETDVDALETDVGVLETDVGALETQVDTIVNDTPGGVTGCTSGQIAKYNGTSWQCQADEIGTDSDTLGALSCASGEIAKWSGAIWECQPDNSGGGGSPFTLTDSAGSPVAVGTVVGIDVAPHPVKIITLLTDTDLSGTSLLSGEKILLPVVAGAFPNVGDVFWTADNCAAGIGDPWIRASAGFLDTILPAVVVDGVLYVADETSVTPSKLFSSTHFGGFACDNFDETISNVVEAVSEGAVSALFTTPFILGGGP